MRGETSDTSITLQVVYLKSLENSLEIELSDTVNKTHPIKISLPDFKKISLYSILRLKYDTEPVDRMKNNISERYLFISRHHTTKAITKFQSIKLLY